MNKQGEQHRPGTAFEGRLTRLEPDLTEALAVLYPDRHDIQLWHDRLLSVAQHAYINRPNKLKNLDILREKDELNWFQSEKMLGYMCYPDRFAGDFQGLKDKIPYLQNLGVTYLHLLSVLKARDGDSDGGFAIEDYMNTNSHLGTIEDLEGLTSELQQAGISLCLDFVFNHTAQEHFWARRAAAGDKTYQDYYYMYPDHTIPEEQGPLLEQVFPASAPGNFTYVRACEKWVWTTFYPYQWDLNYHNPAVLVAMLENLLALANKGVQIFRLDAAIYIWKELGTPCRNLPQTHALLQVFRAIVSMAAPAVALKAEAVAGARHITKYFGPLDTKKRECQLAYHSAAMAALWDSLATGDVRPATNMLMALPDKPKGTSWIYYARCHDDIGWGALRDSKGAPWGASDNHLNFLWRFYAGETKDSFARGRRFQPVPGEAFAGSNGTLASLAGLEKAIEDQDPEHVNFAARRILLMHAIPMALDGIPLIYMGDEMALLNDYKHADSAAHQDGRWLHRPIMPEGNKGYTPMHLSARECIQKGLHSLIKTRKTLTVLGAQNTVEYLVSGNPHIFAFVRRSSEHTLLCLANFCGTDQSVSEGFISQIVNKKTKDVSPLSDIYGPSDGQQNERLGPYQCRWLFEGT